MLLPRELLDLHLKHGARIVDHAIEGYSTLEAEDRALHATCGLLDRSDRGTLRFTGADRIAFLHGLVTNDLKSLEPGGGVYTALLEPKGHMVGDARVLVRRDEVLLDTEPARATPVREYLERHLISEDVEIAEVTVAYALLSLVGPTAAEVVSATLGGTRSHLEEHHHADREGVLVIATRLGALSGLDLLVPVERAAAVLEGLLERGKSHGVSLVGHTAYELARVEAGVPRFGADMDEDTIPLEANLGERAISFTKGCYVGQEIIARASFRGGVRRKLVGLRSEAGTVLTQGVDLFKEAKDVKPAGEVTSGVQSPRFGSIALGYARREHQQPGTVLVTAEGRRVTVCALPFS